MSKTPTRLIITVDTVDEDMISAYRVADAVRDIADAFESEAEGEDGLIACAGNVIDGNGNTVGRWQLK